MDHCSVACNLLTMHTEGHIRGKLIRKVDFTHNPFALCKNFCIKQSRILTNMNYLSIIQDKYCFNMYAGAINNQMKVYMIIYQQKIFP